MLLLSLNSLVFSMNEFSAESDEEMERFLAGTDSSSGPVNIYNFTAPEYFIPKRKKTTTSKKELLGSIKKNKNKKIKFRAFTRNKAAAIRQTLSQDLPELNGPHDIDVMDN